MNPGDVHSARPATSDARPPRGDEREVARESGRAHRPRGAREAGQGPKAGGAFERALREGRGRKGQELTPALDLVPGRGESPRSRSSARELVEAQGSRADAGRERRAARELDPLERLPAGLPPEPGPYLGPLPSQPLALGAAPMTAALAGAGVLPPELLQGLLQFALLTKNKDGRHEFRMGLDPSLLGGATVKLVSYGQRRLGLCVRGGEALDEAELERLVAALRERGIEIAELEFAELERGA